LLPVIPPLDDMMGESWRNGSGNPRHGRRLALHRVIVKKMGCVPIFSCYFYRVQCGAKRRHEPAGRAADNAGEVTTA
jgi:hypothetical protein